MLCGNGSSRSRGPYATRSSYAHVAIALSLLLLLIMFLVNAALPWIRQRPAG